MRRTKKRPLLDVLAGRYPEQSREELLALVLCGDVFVAGERIREPRRQVAADARLQLRGWRYVSRGGDKLAAAIDSWQLRVAGRVFVDAGSSTGGFTDCLLQHGAAHVHAVDVGYNQLAYPLRQDSRVTVHERTNIRDVGELEPVPHAAVCDLSFRSLRGVVAHVLSLTSQHWCVGLIKPQFELGRAGSAGSSGSTAPARPADSGPDSPGSTADDVAAEFDGVVRDVALLRQILRELLSDLSREDVGAEALMRSPVPGRRGNREFLALLRRGYLPDVEALVEGVLAGD